MTTDAEIQADVEAELEWDPSLDSRDILVQVKQGIVTLGGHVPSYANKWSAERATKKVANVRAVANEIDVRPLAKRTDHEIATAALAALSANVSVPASNIKVIVSDGWVKLEGEVEFWYQRNAVEEAVRSLWGVKGIHNGIEIKPHDIDTNEIQGRIRAAFRRHADIDADKVHVTVQGDTVTLAGEVDSWNERQNAENAAWTSPGVRHVKNDLSVAL